MERCPTCQARLRQEPVCPRCRTDLAWPMEIEAQAAAALRRAVALLAGGDDAQAARALEICLRLKRDPLALRLLGFLRSL